MGSDNDMIAVWKNSLHTLQEMRPKLLCLSLSRIRYTIYTELISDGNLHNDIAGEFVIAERAIELFFQVLYISTFRRGLTL